MRALLIIAVLLLGFNCNAALADNTAIPTKILDSSTTDTGPIGTIVGVVEKMDAWVQKNLW